MGYLNKYKFLILGTFMTCFYNGRHVILIASYIGPALIMYYYRKEKSKKSIFISYIAFFITCLYSYNGVTGFDGIFNYAILILISSVLFIPFIFDWILYKKFDGIVSTLILPVAGVSIEYLFSCISPFGTWGALAYSQYGNYPLEQLISVTGIYGVSFIVYWTYSFINYLIENKFNINKVKKVSIIFLISIFSVYFVGGLRIVLSDVSQIDTVKISSISVQHYEVWNDIYNILNENGENINNINRLKSKFEGIHNELFELTKREAQCGAKIIQWHESNGITFKENKYELINKGKKIADEYDIYLLMTVTPIDIKAKNDRNQAILIGPNGNIIYEYDKFKIVPGDIDVCGDGEIKYADTPYGRIGSIICFDADFPQYVMQASKKDIDILLIPSSDWKEINPIHSEMASFRGVENGCSIVRQVQRGLCLSTNYLGKTIDSMDFYTANDKVLVSNVPIKGTRTIYSYIGDLFSWICIIIFIVIIFTKQSNKKMVN